MNIDMSVNTMTSNDAVSLALAFVTKHKISMLAREGLFQLLKKIVPRESEHRMPSWSDVQRTLFLTSEKEIKYDCCENDCIIYYDSYLQNTQYADLTQCPVCNAARYSPGGSPAKVSTIQFIQLTLYTRRMFSTCIVHVPDMSYTCIDFSSTHLSIPVLPFLLYIDVYCRCFDCIRLVCLWVVLWSERIQQNY
jgi:hypothetical protein